MARRAPKPPAPSPGAFATATIASAANMSPRMKKPHVNTERRSLATAWQYEAYRQVHLCGEARYAVSLFSAMAGRAEIGVSEAQTLIRKAVWIKDGPEVDAFAQLAPTVRERSKLIRSFMLHWQIAGECYLIARRRLPYDPDFVEPKDMQDLLDPDAEAAPENPPVWEIVAVTEIRRDGTDAWSVRHENGSFVPLADDEPVIRLWNPDPSNRQEAWSPLRSMLSTLGEIEYWTKHIFVQIKSRLISSGIWFLPDNMTFPKPPASAFENGEADIAELDEASLFLAKLAADSMEQLDADEVGFPSVVMASPEALAMIDKSKLIQFWSEADDKAMIMRSDAVRRFALGMDLPPEQVLGSSGLAVTGAGGSAGSVNHWGVWANEEQTISAHIEPALDAFVGALTESFLRLAVPGTIHVIGYDTAALRLRQDRSKESIELYVLGLLSGKVAVRENGFDPDTDMMDAKERKEWLLGRLAASSPTPEQLTAVMNMLGVNLPAVEQSGGTPSRELSDRDGPRNLDHLPVEGPPQTTHEHKDAPFSAREAAAEVLVLHALSKAGNVVLNSGKRGKDRDRTSPSHLVHVTHAVETLPTFDFSLASTVYDDLNAHQLAETERQLSALCSELYRTGTPFTRAALREALR